MQLVAVLLGCCVCRACIIIPSSHYHIPQAKPRQGKARLRCGAGVGAAAPPLADRLRHLNARHEINRVFIVPTAIASMLHMKIERNRMPLIDRSELSSLGCRQPQNEMFQVQMQGAELAERRSARHIGQPAGHQLVETGASNLKII